MESIVCNKDCDLCDREIYKECNKLSMIEEECCKDDCIYYKEEEE